MALVCRHKITAAISAVGIVFVFVFLLNSQIPNVLEQNTELLPAYLLEAAQEILWSVFRDPKPHETIFISQIIPF